MIEFIEGNWLALASGVVALISLWYARKSATASWTSAQTAQDALAEARRQHRTSIRPYVTADIEKFLKPNAGTYYAVTVTNTGFGALQNGDASFYVKQRPRIGQGQQPQARRAMVKNIPSLDKGASKRIFETSDPLDGVWGMIVCQDIEGNHYWFRRTGWSDAWEQGEGSPPKLEQVDQDA